MKTQLILEVYDTVQVSEDQWRDATKHQLIDVDVPDNIGENLTGKGGARVIGAVANYSLSK
jgi:hypothetical protein